MLRIIPLNINDSIITMLVPIQEKRALGLYLDIESNPIYDAGGYRIPYTDVYGENGYKDDDLNGNGAIHTLHLPSPREITNKTGRFTALFILGCPLGTIGTQIQAPFLDKFWIEMSRLFNCHIDLFNFEEFCPQLVGQILTSSWNMWITPGVGTFAGPDGNDMSLRYNDGFLREMHRHSRRVIKTLETNSYVRDLYPPSIPPITVSHSPLSSSSSAY